MRVVIVFTLIMMGYIAHAQTNPSGFPTQFSTGWFRQGWHQSDSGEIIATRIPNFTPRFPGTTIMYQNAGVDTSLIYWTGGRWVKIDLTTIDTTSLSNRINLKLNISDTASMLLPYLRKVDTTDKWVQDIYVRNDSLFKFRNGIESFLDTLGGGSGAGSVTSVGLSMPSAFSVTGSPITTSGTFNVSGAGTTSQYIRGNGTLATTDSSMIPDFYLKVRGLFSGTSPITYNTTSGVFGINDANTSGTKGAATFTNSDFSDNGIGTISLSTLVSAGSCTGCVLNINASGRITGYSDGPAGATDNSNIGAGFRILNATTQEMRTLFDAFGVIIDSVANTDGLTWRIDTTRGTGIPSYYYVDSMASVAGLPAGNNTELQYNNDGEFGGTTGMTWDEPNTGITVRKNGIGSTPSLTTGLLLENKDTATSGMQQYSPGIWFKGQGWKTGSGGGSQEVMYNVYLRPTEGAASPDADLVFHKYINGVATSTAGFTIEKSGIRISTGGTSTSGGISLNSNVTPQSDVIRSANKLQFASNVVGAGGFSVPIFLFHSSQVLNESGATDHVTDSASFFPSSGNGAYNGFVFRSRIAQSGTASGISRGFYANPDIVNAADFRAFESETGSVIINEDSLAVTQTNAAGLILVNNTAAASAAQQISPAIRWRGYGWKTDATAASQPVDFRAYVLPNQGAFAATGTWHLQAAVNDGSYATRLLVNSNAITGEFMSAGLRLAGGGITVASTSPIANNFNWGANTFTFASTTTTSAAQDVLTFSGTGNATSGSTNFVRYNHTFSPSSGSGIANVVLIAPTINQTGGASGATRGLYIAPTLTVAADFLAIETTAGKTILNGDNVLIGTSTDGGEKFQVDGSVAFDLGSDATGDIYYRNSGGSLTRLGPGTDGQVLTLASGLPSWASSSSSTTVYTGDGTITGTRTISTDGFLTTWAGANTGVAILSLSNTGASNANGLTASATGTTSIGVSGTSSQYIGVYGTSTTNNGVQGNSSSGIGLVGTSSTNAAIRGQINPSSTDAIENIMTLLRTSSSGSGANGIGGAIQFELETASSGTSETVGSLAFRLTDATAATITSQFEIYGVDNAVNGRKAALGGTGQWVWDGYGVGSFTGTPTGTIQVDADGDVIEGPIVSAGLYTPTLTAVLNTSSPLLDGARYTRVGNIVTFSLRFSVTTTSGSSSSSIRATLPVSSSFTNANQAAGTNSGSVGGVEADATNDEIVVTWTSGSGGSETIIVTGQYTIL